MSGEGRPCSHKASTAGIRHLKTPYESILGLENITDLEKNIPSLSLKLNEYGLDISVPVLAELLDDSEATVRVQAAFWLRTACIISPHHARPEHERAAVRVFMDILHVGTSEQRMLAMFFLNVKSNAGFRAAPAARRNAARFGKRC